MANVPEPGRTRRNRFARHPKTTLCLTVVALLVLIELCSYAVILIMGHRELRFQYRYNRILSGYTVFQNVPHHSFRTSAIKSDPSEPDPVLDEHGFLADAPVSLQKPAGVFRIFLIGGSTAFGAGQNDRYHAVHPYPDGLYAYPSSIAGQLKRLLERADPKKRYEVINAAGFERRIHQSFIQYVQTLVRYRPDLIISLEGMNDVYSLASGTPFEDVEQQLPFYVGLYDRPHSWLNYSATYYVLSTAYEKWQSHREQEPAPAPAASPSSNGAAAAGKSSNAREPGRDAYELAKSRYKTNAERLMQIVRQYFAVLQADRTRCLFVLQPLLLRRGVNKHLSEIERSFTNVLVPSESPQARLGDEALLLSYFYDDFLSTAFKDAAGRFGITYLDMNAEIAGLGTDVEFFTDYCHLTPQGNTRVAEVLARAILAGGSSPATSR
jgi:lysophospholipase L1-like esterase